MNVLRCYVESCRIYYLAQERPLVVSAVCVDPTNTVVNLTGVTFSVSGRLSQPAEVRNCPVGREGEGGERV